MMKTFEDLTDHNRNGERKSKQVRICTINRLLDSRNHVIRYSRFFKYLPQRVQDYLLFHKDERKACVTGLKYLIQKYSLQLHLLLENEEWLKAPHELDIILQTKQVTYPQNGKKTIRHLF